MGPADRPEVKSRAGRRSSALPTRLALPAWLGGLAPWLLAPLLVVVAYRHAPGVEFVGDARMLILDNRFMGGLEHLWDNLTHNYFWSSAGHLVPYWRPLTKGSWWLERQLFGSFAGGFALVQIGWHLLAALGTQLLGRAWGLRRWAAAVAATIVGLHPISIAPVSMIMARSDVVATAAVVWAVLGWWHWRRRSSRWRAWAVTHLVALLIGLGSKETVAALPALLVAYSLLDGDYRPARRRRLGLLVPSIAATAAYLAARTWILGREAPGLESVSLGFDPLRLVACLAKYLENLWPLGLSSTVRDLPILEAKSTAFWMLGAPTLAAALAVAVFAIRRRDQALLGCLLWIGAVLAPVLLPAKIHVPAIEDKYPLADRWLYHALPAAALGFSRLAQLLRPGWLERAFHLGVAGWATLLLLRSGPARAEFATELGMLDNEDRAYYYATPPEFRTAQDHCRFHERRVERGVRAADDRRVVAAFAPYQASCRAIPTGRRLQLLQALVRLEQHAAAKSVVLRLVQEPPRQPAEQRRLARLAGTVYGRTGEPARAVRWLSRAWQLGDRDCRVLVELAEASRALDDLRAAVHRLEQAFECGGRRDPSLLLAAATWSLDEGDLPRARRLIAEVRRQAKLSPDQRAQLEYLRARLRGDPGTTSPGRVPVLRPR
ncbi:MAG: hypothetical protein JRI23_25700 [Deltaproteobacteria bacterium]|jgi:hypothetical protein|nr:hypothetical protein [Deltaproteobacteria bacterium]MBW2535422.1 hypothetical protein [Deltaproteobacteria bacterium]